MTPKRTKAKKAKTKAVKAWAVIYGYGNTLSGVASSGVPYLYKTRRDARDSSPWSDAKAVRVLITPIQPSRKGK